MTSNNETVSRQMPWAGIMTSNGKQVTVTSEMLTAVGRHLSIKWLFVFHRFDPFVLSTCFPRLLLGKHWDSRETKFTVPLGTSHCFNWFDLHVEQSLSLQNGVVLGGACRDEIFRIDCVTHRRVWVRYRQPVCVRFSTFQLVVESGFRSLRKV